MTKRQKNVALTQRGKSSTGWEELGSDVLVYILTYLGFCCFFGKNGNITVSKMFRYCVEKAAMASLKVPRVFRPLIMKYCTQLKEIDVTMFTTSQLESDCFYSLYVRNKKTLRILRKHRDYSASYIGGKSLEAQFEKLTPFEGITELHVGGIRFPNFTPVTFPNLEVLSLIGTHTDITNFRTVWNLTIQLCDVTLRLLQEMPWLRQLELRSSVMVAVDCSLLTTQFLYLTSLSIKTEGNVYQADQLCRCFPCLTSLSLNTRLGGFTNLITTNTKTLKKCDLSLFHVSNLLKDLKEQGVVLKNLETLHYPCDERNSKDCMNLPEVAPNLKVIHFSKQDWGLAKFLSPFMHLLDKGCPGLEEMYFRGDPEASKKVDKFWKKKKDAFPKLKCFEMVDYYPRWAPKRPKCQVKTGTFENSELEKHYCCCKNAF